MALGYVFGIEVSNNTHLGWYWGFIIKGFVVLHILLFQFVVIKDNAHGVFLPLLKIVNLSYDEQT